MGKLGRVGWKPLATELFIVFIGLLGALQVDDWQQHRELAQTETVYLHRLNEDLASYIMYLKRGIPRLEQHRRGVEHVSASLAAGHILNDDTDLFELGLIYLGHLPSANRPMSAYNEMVASGVFARLQSTELQRLVSDLYATQAAVDKNFAWWRNQPLVVEQAIQPFVEYYSEGERVPSTNMSAPAYGVRIKYDFDKLAADPVIRNGYFWAADTHSDWVEWSNRLLDLAVAAEAIVAKELQGR